MPSLKGTETEQSLKEGFASEIHAIRRYLDFAQKAEVEGLNDVAALFRSTAEGENRHAHGHLEYLEEVGPVDPLNFGPCLAIALGHIQCGHDEAAPEAARKTF